MRSKQVALADGALNSTQKILQQHTLIINVFSRKIGKKIKFVQTNSNSIILHQNEITKIKTPITMFSVVKKKNIFKGFLQHHELTQSPKAK